VNKSQRIGVLGGTFDPIHNVHLAMARAAIKHARLDKVLFVVSGRPPHKSTGPCASAENRFAMAEAATASESKMEASRLEIDRGGVSYTRDTLEALSKQSPGDTLFLILGFDSLLDLPNWRAPGRVLELARILVVPRPGANGQVPTELEGHYDMLPFEPVDIASTTIRQRIATGGSIEELVPAPVVRYILGKGLYT